MNWLHDITWAIGFCVVAVVAFEVSWWLVGLVVEWVG